jgi:hypothetical protein
MKYRVFLCRFTEHGSFIAQEGFICLHVMRAAVFREAKNETLFFFFVFWYLYLNERKEMRLLRACRVARYAVVPVEAVASADVSDYGVKLQYLLSGHLHAAAALLPGKEPLA